MPLRKHAKKLQIRSTSYYWIMTPQQQSAAQQSNSVIWHAASPRTVDDHIWCVFLITCHIRCLHVLSSLQRDAAFLRTTRRCTASAQQHKTAVFHLRFRVHSPIRASTPKFNLSRKFKWIKIHCTNIFWKLSKKLRRCSSRSIMVLWRFGKV